MSLKNIMIHNIIGMIPSTIYEVAISVSMEETHFYIKFKNAG